MQNRERARGALPPLQAFLLQLLPPLAELLLHRCLAALMLLVRLGHLLTGLGQQLLTLLTGLVPKLRHLAFSLLPNRLAVDQLFPLLAGLRHDLLGLLTGLGDELVFLAHEGVGLGQLRWQGLPHRIHQLDRILLIHQAAAAEGNPGAVQHDFLELIELVEHGADRRLRHHRDAGDD